MVTQTFAEGCTLEVAADWCRLPIRATNVLCSDGKRRNVKLLRYPDSYSTIPGKVVVSGKTVTGFVWVHSLGGLRFSPDAWRKNAHVLPKWER